jgi:SpoVK/Ycf46/Vps4 family AAA+-type ATPase
MEVFPMSVQLGTTQSDHSDLSHSEYRREGKSKLLPHVIQKIFEVHAVSQVYLREKNVVWMSSFDFAHLFGTQNDKAPRYVQIADQVFRVAVSTIEDGKIGMSTISKDSINEGLYSSDGTATVVATPFDMDAVIPFPVKKIVIEIENEKAPFSHEDQHIINVNTLKKHVLKALDEEVLTRHKSLFLSLPGCSVKVTVSELYPACPVVDENSFVGMIIPDTEITFIDALSSPTFLVDKVYKEEIERIDMHVSLSKRSLHAVRDTLPLVLSKNTLLDLIQKKYQGQVISPGALITIQHENGWDILISFKTGVLKPGVEELNQTKYHNYNNGFLITKDTPIRLQPGKDILLTSGNAIPADQITFKITDMPGYQTVEIDHDKERWVSLVELKQAILELKRPFAAKEIIELSLSSGKFLIEVRKAHSDSDLPTAKPSNEASLWTIEENTDIQFVAEKELNVNLIRDWTVHPVKKAMIHIFAERVPDDGLTLTQNALKKLALAQAPERLVKNHSFTILTQERDLLTFKLMRAIFDESIGETKETTVFGKLTDESEIEFSTSAKENLTLVEKVHSDEIAAMRFTMRAIKQMDAAKHTHPPLVLKRENITRMIREELSKHPHITQGFETVFHLDNGWDIAVTFRKGILKKDSERSGKLLSASSTEMKEGYAATDETEIQLMGGGDLIALTQGDPIEASRMHVKITSIKEDFTTQDTALEKGAWINSEELAKELLALQKSFVSSETILVNLESGRYILSVKGAKPKDPAATLPKKRKEISWKITDSTKLNVDVEKGLDLTIVQNGTVYPLKKIKFLASPTNKSGHISLKEEELRQALMEVLPDRLIKGQILSLDTKKNHSVRVEVEELTPINEDSSINTTQVFTCITDDTEVIFRGKEKTTIAVRSEPKILEVDDPIEYLESLGMGGIDKEFAQIFRIFFSRSDRLNEEARRRGTQPIKGVLLYGPPGTGKTTLARHLGEMVGCSGERLQLITATEVFNMWFGQSEENIRELFKPAMEAQQKYGDKSPLYIVIVDEIDALLPKRGGSVNKVRDSLVNQFLGALDGLKKVTNLLVIGLTNRKEEMDPAALRHGRLGVHVEIGLPNLKARRKIFEIHTRRLLKEGLLHENVDLDLLAEKTDKLPGAFIEGIVESASLFSLERLSKLKSSKDELRSHPDGIVTMKDFEKALNEQHKDEEKIPESVQRMYL